MENTKRRKWYIEVNMLLEHRLPGRISGDKVSETSAPEDYTLRSKQTLATMWEWMERLRCWAKCYLQCNIVKTTAKKEKRKQQLDGTYYMLATLLSTLHIAVIICYKYNRSCVCMINLFNLYNNPIRCVRPSPDFTEDCSEGSGPQPQGPAARRAEGGGRRSLRLCASLLLKSDTNCSPYSVSCKDYLVLCT